ncbi:MAG: nucleotidyltransferase domain-containing protein [Lachnospiraceae bacterium]|nr:nucleotidyltransferase domain-containing protein [Lachnospiraceae bacterium]
MLTIDQIANGVAEVSKEYPLRKVELFGSYANGNNTADSDVDLLVEFVNPRVSLLTLAALKYRLEELLGTDVDVVHGPLEEDCMLEVDRRIPLYGTQR